MIFDFHDFETLEKEKDAYPPEKITYLIDAWIMVADLYLKDKKKLREHVGIFAELKDMTCILGGYVFHKASQPLKGKPSGTEVMIGDAQYDRMEKDLEALGVPKKHVAGLLNTYIQTEILGEGDDIERAIFGKTLKEIS